MKNIEEILEQFYFDINSYIKNLDGEDFRKSRDRAYRLAEADINKYVADYIESIVLPKHREMTEEMTPPSELTNAYLLNQWAILEDLNGVTEAYNQALEDCQAKLDEAVKALKENK